MALASPLSGIIPPMVTPLAAPDRIDQEGAAKLVEHLIEGGVSGIFLLGTCGEGPALSFKMRSELVDCVCTLVADRLPVLVGVSDPSIDDAVGLAEHAADCGADAVVSTLPFYYQVGEREQADHLLRIAKRSPLPCVVYNMPGCVPSNITIEMLRRFIDEPNIIGFKDSSGDLEMFGEFCDLVIQQRPQWCRLMGPEHLLIPAVEAGGTGGVNGGANVAPSLFSSLYDATISKNLSSRKIYAKQAEVLARLYGAEPSATSVIQGLKMALYLSGICSHMTTELFGSPTDSQWDTAETVIAQLATWGLATA